jgi:hypothetical protein
MRLVSSPATSIVARSSSLCGASRASIAPFIAFTAQAAITPSATPPMPMSMSTLV